MNFRNQANSYNYSSKFACIDALPLKATQIQTEQLPLQGSYKVVSCILFLLMSPKTKQKKSIHKCNFSHTQLCHETGSTLHTA